MDLLTANEVTALANSLWTGILLVLAFTLISLLWLDKMAGNWLYDDTRRSAQWGLLACLCGAGFRGYWLMAVLTAPAGKPWAQWAAEYRPWLIVLVLGIVAGVFRGSMLLVPTKHRRWITWTIAAFLATLAGVSVWIA